MQRTAALRMVAEDTGAIAVVGTNNIAAQYQAIVRDAGSYYLLGYTPSTLHRDGKFHDIRVRVKRPGLQVRARRGYYAPPPDAKTLAPPPLPEGLSSAAREALRMPISRHGLTIDLFSAPFKRSGNQAAVVVGGQITGDLRLDAADRVALSYQVFTPEGKVQTGGYKVFTLNLRPDARAGAVQAGIRFLEPLTLPPGRYELRLVIDQPGGALGSVVTDLDVPAFDGELALGGVLLGSASTSGHVTLQADAPLRSLLGTHPTAVRRFARGDVLTLLTEVYLEDAQAEAGQIAVTARLTTVAGTEVTQAAAALSKQTATEPTTGARWDAVAELLLTEVPAGNYVLTVTAVHQRTKQEVSRRIPLAVEE